MSTFDLKTSALSRTRPGLLRDGPHKFIRLNPGVSKVEVYRNCAGHPKPFGGRPNYLDRLISRRLVCNLGRSNRYRLYAWNAPDDDRYRPHARQEPENNDRPAQLWAPAGHP